MQCQQAEQDLVTAKSEEARVSKEVAAAAAGLQSQISTTQASIAELEKLIPGDISLNYKRLVQTHGAAAFAAVEGSTCTSCYVSIPPQHHVILKTGQSVVCKTCGKLQYVQQEVVTS